MHGHATPRVLHTLSQLTASYIVKMFELRHFYLLVLFCKYAIATSTCGLDVSLVLEHLGESIVCLLFYNEYRVHAVQVCSVYYDTSDRECESVA